MLKGIIIGLLLLVSYPTLAKDHNQDAHYYNEEEVNSMIGNHIVNVFGWQTGGFVSGAVFVGAIIDRSALAVLGAGLIGGFFVSGIYVIKEYFEHVSPRHLNNISW